MIRLPANVYLHLIWWRRVNRECSSIFWVAPGRAEKPPPFFSPWSRRGPYLCRGRRQDPNFAIRRILSWVDAEQITALFIFFNVWAFRDILPRKPPRLTLRVRLVNAAHHFFLFGAILFLYFWCIMFTSTTTTAHFCLSLLPLIDLTR